MTKHLCTASIFLVLVASIAASIWIRVPNTCWWMPSMRGGSTVPLLVWIIPNVVGPIVGLAGVVLIVASLWSFAELLCAKLREVFHG